MCEHKVDVYVAKCPVCGKVMAFMNHMQAVANIMYHMQIHHVFIPYEIAQKAVTHTTICIDKQVKKLEERRENVMKEIEELGVKA